MKKSHQVDFGPPIALYTLTQPELEKGGFAAATANHQLQYEFKGDGRHLGEILLRVDPATQIGHLDGGGFVTGSSPGLDLEQIIDSLSAMSEVRGGSYEVRQVELRWGTTRTTLLWLKSDTDDQDLIYPLYGIFRTNVFPRTLYKVTEFINLLHASTLGALTGTIVANGQPLPGVEVTLFIGNFAKTWKAMTDSNGVFTFADLPYGMEYSVSASSAGLVGVEQGSPLPVGNTTRLPKPLELGRPCTISGTVLEQDGQPAAKAVIAYQRPHLEYGVRSSIGLATKTINVGGTASGSTDAAGHFTLSGIPAGQYIVTAVLRPDGAQPPQFGSMQTIELAEGANLKLDQPMRLAQAGSISGRVVDLSGHPAAKASVSVSKNALQFSVRLTTDDNGNFQAASLPPGEYSLYISLHDQTISIQGVEVQPGAETKLPDPVQLKPFQPSRIGN